MSVCWLLSPHTFLGACLSDYTSVCLSVFRSVCLCASVISSVLLCVICDVRLCHEHTIFGSAGDMLNAASTTEGPAVSQHSGLGTLGPIPEGKLSRS